MENESSNVESFRETLSASFRSAGFWSVIAAVAGVITAVAGTVLVLFIEEIRNFSIIVLITGLTLLFIALVLSPRAVAMFMAGRRGRYGTNVAIMTVAFFAIVVLLNFLFFRTSTRFDTTATRIFTLSPKTVQVLERLPSLVRANAFFVPATNRMWQKSPGGSPQRRNKPGSNQGNKLIVQFENVQAVGQGGWGRA